jgi:hypothetical protein
MKFRGSVFRFQSEFFCVFGYNLSSFILELIIGIQNKRSWFAFPFGSFSFYDCMKYFKVFRNNICISKGT